MLFHELALLAVEWSEELDLDHPGPHAYWLRRRDSITTHGFKGNQNLYIYS
jgi:hypothetical protein